MKLPGPLRRNMPLRRYTPIRKVSARQMIELGRRVRLKQQMLREIAKEGERPLCVRCGQLPDWRGIQLVHRVPLSRGGKTTRENCELWCAPCHFGPQGHRTEGMNP